MMDLERENERLEQLLSIAIEALHDIEQAFDKPFTIREIVNAAKAEMSALNQEYAISENTP